MSDLSKIAIVTDSSCDLSDAQLEQHHIHMVSLRIVCQNAEYRDRVELSQEQLYELLKSEIAQDFKHFNVIEVSSEIVYSAVKVIDKYQLKSLDSLHLATALAVKTDIDFFISSDQKLLKAAETEGFKVINPNE